MRCGFIEARPVPTLWLWFQFNKPGLGTSVEVTGRSVPKRSEYFWFCIVSSWAVLVDFKLSWLVQINFLKSLKALRILSNRISNLKGTISILCTLLCSLQLIFCYQLFYSRLWLAICHRRMVDLKLHRFLLQHGIDSFDGRSVLTIRHSALSVFLTLTIRQFTSWIAIVLSPNCIIPQCDWSRSTVWTILFFLHILLRLFFIA